MRYLLLFSICLSSVFSYGQSKKIAFKLGNEYELPKGAQDLAFAGNQKDGLVNLALKKDELTIVKFNPSTLDQTNASVIELPELTKNFNSEIVAEFGDKYFWIHSDWDKENQKELLYYDKVDVTTGKITSANNKMLESSKISGSRIGGSSMGFSFGGNKVVDKYDFNFDADHKKLMVSYRLIPENKKDKENYDKIGIAIFDENMNKLWENVFTMPYTEAQMDNADFSIDSKGNAYMLAKVYDSDSRKERDKDTDKAGYHYEVLKFSKNNKEIIHTTIDVGDFFIKESSLIESVTHDMIIACTYSKKVKGSGTDGIFLAMVDAAGKVTKYKNGYYEFPLNELQKFETARRKRKMEKKDDYEAPNIKVRNVLIDQAGGVLITCEEFYLVVTSSYSASTHSTTYYYTYHYEDILAAKVSADGKFEWLRKIPKMQKGTTTGGMGSLPGTMGYKLIADASGYYFLFLDNKKNVELAEDEAPKYHVDGAGGQVMVAKIDPKGVVSKELLFDTRDEDVMVFPRKFNQINSSQFIGRAKVNKKTFRPLLITVN